MFIRLKSKLSLRIISITAFAGILVFISLYLLISSAPKKNNNPRQNKPAVKAMPQTGERKEKVEPPIQKVKEAKVPILMYHHLIANPNPAKYPSVLFVNENTFKQQIKYLKENSYNTILIKELLAAFDGKFELPKKPVILTFDDGYRDHYEKAFKLLSKNNMKATFYIPTYILNKTQDYWLKEDMIRKMAEGGMEIGAHSVNHPFLTDINQSQLTFEIYVSKRELKNITGDETVSFSYPGCLYNDEVIKMLKQAKYKGAVACGTGSIQEASERYELKRRTVTNDMEYFKSLLETK